MKTIFAIIIALVLIGGAILFTRNDKSSSEKNIPNVSIVNGIQIIEIKARGGYQPRTSIAKSGIPTVLRFNTKGTFDCSSFVRIPSLNINQTLPQSGITDIDLGIQKVGILNGSCSMGMYPFTIKFQE